MVSLLSVTPLLPAGDDLATAWRSLAESGVSPAAAAALMTGVVTLAAEGSLLGDASLPGDRS